MKIPTQALKERMVVEDWAGSGAYGVMLGEPRTVRASLQPTSRVVVTATGQSLRADLVILIRPEDGPIRPESRLRIDSTTGLGDQDPQTWRVLECAGIPSPTRPSHYEILAASWRTGSPGVGSGDVGS